MNICDRDIAAVRQRLLESQALVPAEMAAPVNYVSLRDNIFLRELDAEVKALLQLLNTPEKFAEKFKERCMARDGRQDQSIPFADYRDSPVNQLYWDIAALVFQPATLKDMLAIVMPGVTRSLEVSFPDILPTTVRDTQSLRAAVENLVPVLTTSNLDALTAAPTLEELSHYVVVGDMVFDIRKMQPFPLGVHSQLYKALQQQYPALAEKLYAHNYALTVLKTDIFTFQEKGKTPYAALLELKKSFILSGKKMTGSEFASKRAAIGIAEFMNYFDNVPEKLKEKLLSLEGTKNLKEIINDIVTGNCVEVTASNINELLEKNADHPLLNAVIPMSDLNHLLKRYQHSRAKPDALLSKHENPDTLLFPVTLLKLAIKGMTIHHPEDLIDLMLNFSPEHYDMLLSNLTITETNEFIRTVMIVIDNHLLSAAQHRALIATITENYRRFNFETVEQALLWAIANSGHYADTLESLINRYPKENLFITDPHGKTVLHHAAASPQGMRILLDLIPKDQRLEALEKSTKQGESVLHFAATHPEVLKVIFERLPESQYLKAITARDVYDCMVIHRAATNPFSVKYLLGVLNEGDRLNVVNTKIKNGNTMLHYTAETPGSLRLVLAVYPSMAERLEAVKVENSYQGTLLHCAYLSPESLKIILELYPEDQRLEALKMRDAWGDSALKFIADSPLSILCALELLPENQRLEVVKTCGQWDRPALRANMSDQVFLSILKLIPEAERLQALMTAYYEGCTPLSLVELPHLLAILALLPLSDRPYAVSTPVDEINNGMSVLQLTNMNQYPANVKSLKEIYIALYADQAAQIVKQALLEFVGTLSRLLTEKKNSWLTKKLSFLFPENNAIKVLAAELQVIESEIVRISTGTNDLETLLTLQHILVGKLNTFVDALNEKDLTSAWFQSIAAFLEKDKLPVSGISVRGAIESARAGP